jgi:hypothetical protein
MSQRRDPGVPRPPRAERSPLLSVCSVLILSGFLLGMSVASQLSTELRGFVVLTGMAGLVAFLGLDHVAIRRRLWLERREQDYMATRLAQHISSTGGHAAINDEELMSLVRQAAQAMDHSEELVPAGTDA